MICINLNKNHNFGCNSEVIGRCEENKAETLEIIVPESLRDKWLYLDFEKADNTKFKTPRIDITNGKAYYQITNNLTDVIGKLKVEIIFQDAENLVWKSFTKKYTIVESICATDEIAEENPDFITNAQEVVDKANNLDLEVSKTGTVSTVTITKKDGTEKSVEINDGEIGEGVPTGGTTGQVLKKASNYDYDTIWQDESGGGIRNHNELENLDYENSGHIGFAPAGNYVEDESYVHTDNNYTSEEKNKLSGLSNYDDSEVKQDISDLETNKANTSDIPTKLSDLSNDTNFIDNTTNNLTNYYLKTETYTQEEVNNLIGQIEKVTLEIVQQLPVTGETNKIYLVPKVGSTNDIYDEYIWINNSWEHIGSTEVDLSNYYTKNETDNLLTNKANSSDLSTVATSGSYNDLSNKPTIPTATSDLTNDSNFIDNTVNNLSNYYDKDYIDTTVGSIESLLEVI